MVLGAQEKFRLFQLVETFTKRAETQVSVSCIDEAAAFGPAYSSGERTRAFLKVQDGCDYTCSFCTIPMARGRSRSHPVEATLAQAREVAARGYREVVLSGVNIGLYGQEHGTDLLALLRALDRVEGIDRYRISSIEPNLLTDAIIDFVAASERFQPHFHVPLQSGDDEVLWEDEHLRGGEDPVVLDLDVDGVEVLSLRVEFGHRYDIGDHVALADAWLLADE